MMNVLAKILHSRWAIDPNYAKAAYPIVSRLLENGKLESPLSDGIKPVLYEVDGEGGGVVQSAEMSGVMVLQIDGVLMRNDQLCGPEGTSTMASLIKEADESESIQAIVLEINSPGGEVDGTEEFAATIKACNTPTYALCHMACSAAYWAASACDEIWMSARTSIVGSVGAACSFMDVKGAWEKQGVKMHEVYARTSPDKNKAIRDAMDGDYEGLQNELDKIDAIFMQDVSANRQGVDKSALTGKTYLAEEAMQVGLADKVGGLDNLLHYIINTMSQPRENSMLAKFFGMFTKDEDVTLLHDEIKATAQAQAMDGEEEEEEGSEMDALKSRVAELEAENQSLRERLAEYEEDTDEMEANNNAMASKVAMLEQEVASLKDHLQSNAKAVKRQPTFGDKSHNAEARHKTQTEEEAQAALAREVFAKKYGEKWEALSGNEATWRKQLGKRN